MVWCPQWLEALGVGGQAPAVGRFLINPKNDQKNKSPAPSCCNPPSKSELGNECHVDLNLCLVRDFLFFGLFLGLFFFSLYSFETDDGRFRCRNRFLIILILSDCCILNKIYFAYIIFFFKFRQLFLFLNVLKYFLYFSTYIKPSIYLFRSQEYA